MAHVNASGKTLEACTYACILTKVAEDALFAFAFENTLQES